MLTLRLFDKLRVTKTAILSAAERSSVLASRFFITGGALLGPQPSLVGRKLLRRLFSYKAIPQLFQELVQARSSLKTELIYTGFPLPS